ncbi:kinase-like domain-containing protein [Desarmillaria tabescens]|uniref:Kinase-like domain-containing protein n=1 Tax=Armillaria tabescens TaxID=1929756 RepID=A0AA39NFW5_ARMTA|nr:kinase-like domain-containing protein [Desarmillaria tabescens]KAK0464896.1 kinase-like domain-containing protein [Desarmillaria tabescens]
MPSPANPDDKQHARLIALAHRNVRLDVFHGCWAEPLPFLTAAIFRWIRGEPIGRGSYGCVYLGCNANTGEIIAVKQVELPKMQFATNQQMEVARALKFESETLKDLDHPHIVRYLGYEESPESLNIFLEYVPGGTIESCLFQHGRFSESLTKSFTSQILEGLEYLHCRGIIHRPHNQDLKAANILVDHSGICKISDFGISKRIDHLEERANTSMKGTVFWMAPEVVSPKSGGYDLKVDIWSIGCIVLEMWSGKRPWAGQETIAVMLKLHKDKLPPPIPKDLHLSELALSFRNSCFATNPAKRPMAAELRKHPYLTPVPGWSFTQAEIEPPPEKLVPSRKHDATRLVVPEEKASSRSISRIPRRPSSSSALGQRQTNHQHTHFRNASKAVLPAKPDYGRPPPLVFITPPSSPMKSAFGSTPEDDDQVFNWAATSDSSKSSYQRPKMFYVVNPDSDDSDGEGTIRRHKSSKSSYIYHPPPLPSAEVEPPFSSTVTAPNQLYFNTHYPQHSPSFSPASALTSTSTNYSTLSSSDSSDFGTSLWQKPPISAQPVPSPPPLPSPPSYSDRKASARLSRIEGWHRPHLEDVYQRLDYYFPEHDVDRPVVKADTVASQPKDRHMRKSIRMVAQEQLNRNLSDPECRLKRSTTLWGGRIEEAIIR